MQTNEKTRRLSQSLKNNDVHNDMQNENLKLTSGLPVENSYEDDIDNDDGNVDWDVDVSIAEDNDYGTGNNEEDEDGYADKAKDELVKANEDSGNDDDEFAEGDK